MKKLYTLISLLFLLSSIRSSAIVCDSLTASFSDSLSADGSTHYFSNLSTVAYTATYSWSFGDGTTSTAFNPVHTYTTAGVYTIILNVIWTDGSEMCTDSGTFVGYFLGSDADTLSGNISFDGSAPSDTSSFFVRLITYDSALGILTAVDSTYSINTAPAYLPIPFTMFLRATTEQSQYYFLLSRVQRVTYLLMILQVHIGVMPG